MKAAITISLVKEAKGGPFVFWDDFAAGCEKAETLGFDAVEIFAPSANVIDPKRLNPLLDRHGLKVAAVGTGAGWIIHKWHLCHANPDIRRPAREFIRQMIDVAGQFGASAIVGSMQGRVEGETTRAEALDWLQDALNDLGEHAARQGRPLLFEPINRYETNLFNRVNDAAAFLRTLKTKGIKILADLYHMNIEEASIAGALREAGEWIGHVHFADSNRHAIGFGHTEMAPVMTALRDIGYAGYLSAEILPLPDSETAARQTLKAYKELTGAL